MKSFKRIVINYFGTLAVMLPSIALFACGTSSSFATDKSDIPDKPVPPTVVSIMKDIKAEVPAELFPGVYQSSAEYDALKHSPWVKSTIDPYHIEPNHFTVLKNNYVTFNFRKDFTDVVTSLGYTLENIAQKVFDQLNLSPTVQLLKKELLAQFVFSVGEESSRTYATTGTYDNDINVHPTLKYIQAGAFLEMLAIICAKEYNQVESLGLTPKYLPSISFNQAYLNVLYKGFVDYLPNYLNFDRYREIYNTKDLPWNEQPDSIGNFKNWFSGEMSYEAITLTNLLRTNTKLYHFEGGYEAVDSIIAEIFSRFTNFFTAKFLETNKKDANYLAIFNMFDPISHIYNYNFFNENDPLQSFHFMKALLHTWYDLGNKSGLSLYVNRESNIDSKFKIDEVRFKSFGSTYTKDLKAIQIIDKDSGRLIKELPITHQKYPIGFNKNPFTEYEYKYVAEGAYVNDDSKWDVTLHSKDDLIFKVIKNDGTALLESDLTVQINFMYDITKSYYLNNNVWTPVDDLYK